MSDLSVQLTTEHCLFIQKQHYQAVLTTKESEAHARVQDAGAEMLRNRRKLVSKFFAKCRQFLSSNGVLFIHR